MTPKAPHLPAKSSAASAQKQIRSVRNIILISLLSVLAGATAALVTLAWFLPTIDSSDYIYFGHRPLASADAPPTYNPALEREVSERQLMVFDTRKQTFDDTITDEAKLGKAVILTSDGWVVLYMDAAVVPAYQYLSGIDHNGVVHKAQQAIYDQYRNVLYVKFAGTDFLSQAFADWSRVGSDDYVWLTNGSWELGRISKLREPEARFNVWQYSVDYTLYNDAPESGTVAYNENGRFVGFITSDGVLSLAWPIQLSFPQVAQTAEVPTVDKNWTGTFTDGYIQSQTGIWINKPAFLVTKVSGTDTLLEAGDLIVTVAGRSVSKESFAYLLSSTPSPFTVALIRDGKEMQITIE